MGVGDVSVDVLDLVQVLLGDLDQLWPRPFLREGWGALVLGGRVLIVVPVPLGRTGRTAGQRAQSSD